jgi:sigma-B regulation protein RsbU (phosphoserine phosphatase)
VEDRSPAHALRVLNHVLQKDATDRFCTVACLRLEQTDNGWDGMLSSGGHPLPLLRRTDGTVSPVGEPSPLLGVLPDAEYREEPVTLQPQDMLVLYTDGVTEARRGKQFYGEDRIRAVLAARFDNSSDVAETLLRDAVDFQAGVPRDDIAIVVLGVPGGSP